MPETTKIPYRGTPTIFCLAILCLLTTHLHAEGNISINGLRINSAPPVSRVTAGYLEVINSTAEAVVLLGVSSPDYERIEIHRSVMHDDIATMEPVHELTVPSGSTLEFIPGQLHLMLFRSDQPLSKGDVTTLIFRFSNGQSLSQPAEIVELTLHHHH